MSCSTKNLKDHLAPSGAIFVYMEVRVIQGFGINDADYAVQPYLGNGKQGLCPFYDKYRSMVTRVYSQASWKKRPHYKGVTICDEWRYFSKFKTWMEGRNWEGMQLDKDILVQGCTEYSPTTCIFVPKYINSLLTDSRSTCGEWPIGVSKRKQQAARGGDHPKPFLAHVGGVGGRYNGIYATPEEAHKVWQRGKATAIELAVKKWEESGCKSYSEVAARALLDRSVILRSDADHGIETVKI